MLDLEKEMITKTLEEKRTRMREEIEKEYLNKRNTVPKALRTKVEHVGTEVEHLKKEFEQAEVQREDDLLTMAVNTAKS